MKKGIIAVASSVLGAVIGVGVTVQKFSVKTKRFQGYADKHLAMVRLMSDWLRAKQENKSIADYLKNQGYKNIAIYGMSYLGENLLYELLGSDINVIYGIDKNADNIYSDINILTPDQDLEEVDAVIVTAITFFDEVAELLSDKLECPILSLEDIIYDL